MTITLTLTIPDPALSPNARGIYWMKKANAVKAARQEAGYTALSWLNERRLEAPRWKQATVKARFYFREKRRRDRDNCAGSLKATWDGLADAKIFENDSGVTHLPPEIHVDPKNPRLEIEIEGASP